jgi:hypothetical protein
MKNIIEMVKKYKVYILGVLLALFFMRSCSRGVVISKMEKSDKVKIEEMDSLKSVITLQKNKIDSFAEVLREEKLSIYLYLDDTISRVDRSPQLMGLHKMIKDEVKKLQK